MRCEPRQLLAVTVLLALSVAFWIWLDGGEQRNRLREQLKILSTSKLPDPSVARHSPLNRHGVLLPDHVDIRASNQSGYILSVNIAEPYLFDSRLGLLAEERKQGRRRKRLKGRPWEYSASVVLYRDGVEISNGIVGLRAHGDVKPATRESFLSEKCPDKGRDFRLYNRSNIRPVYFPDHLFEGKLERDPKTLVIRRKKAVRNYIAYRAAERIGAKTPANGLAHFEINGQSHCTVLVSEHVSSRQFGPDIDPGGAFHRFKDPFGRSKGYRQLGEWLKSEPGFDEITQKIELENFTAHIFTILYLANRDWVQGAAIRPSNEGKWFWVLWDLDTTFRKVDFNAAAIPLFTRRINNITRLFERLMQFPRYQRYFRRFIIDRLNHRLDPHSIDKIFDGMDLVNEDDIREATSIYSAMNTRRIVLLEDLNKHIGRPKQIIQVNLRSPHPITYSVDDYPRFNSTYTGIYFAGQTIKVSTRSSDVVAWNVNGSRRVGRELEIELNENLEIFPELSSN